MAFGPSPRQESRSRSSSIACGSAGIWTRITLPGSPQHTGLNVADLVEPRSARYAKLALERSVQAKLRGESIRLLSPEDFVLFKALSTRERDLEDAASVVRQLGARLDLGVVREGASGLASEIPDHEVEERLRRILDLAAAPA